jgi:hypothetical protein
MSCTGAPVHDITAVVVTTNVKFSSVFLLLLLISENFSALVNKAG